MERTKTLHRRTKPVKKMVGLDFHEDRQIGLYHPKYFIASIKAGHIYKKHILLRELLDEDIKSWRIEFKRRVEQSTNFERCIPLNLSPIGTAHRLNHDASFYGANSFMTTGYAYSDAGIELYMDEVETTGPQSKIKTISQNLFDVIVGFFLSMRDGYITNFKADVIENKIISENNKHEKSPSIIKSTPKNLSEMFRNDASYLECMDALRKVKDPIISDDNIYLLGSKQKSALTAWYEILKVKQKLKPGITAAIVATLLNKEIEGLNLFPDGTTLHRTGTTMYIKYKVPLSKLIS